MGDPAPTKIPAVAGSKRPVYSKGTLEAITLMANMADATWKKPGYRKIAAKLQADGWQVALEGVKSVCNRLKKSEGNALKVIQRKKGSGRKFRQDAVDAVRAAHSGNPSSPLRDIARETGAKRST